MTILNTTTAAIFAAAAFAAPAAAATYTVDSLTVSGTIFENRVEGASTTVSIDYWIFDVVPTQTVTIDVLAYNVLNGDNSEGRSGLDSVIRVFAYDPIGDLNLLGAEVAANDDHFSSDGNGSISSLDSLLTFSATESRYVVALSDFGFSESEARAGVNQTSFGGTFADYQLDFTGIDVSPVPLPAGLPLMLAGVGVFGLMRRRRG